MLEQIVNLVKGKVGDIVSQHADIPEDKKEETVKATTTSLVEGLQQYLTADNMSALTSLLGGAKTGGSTGQTGGMLSGIQNKIASTLTSTVGLNASLAQTIASKVVPAVMSLFSKKVDDDNEPGFNVGSLLKGLTGGSSGSSTGGGGLMDMVGSLFGKK